MAEISMNKVKKGDTKIRNVPIAVTPEGFWCCPSPVALQKNFKTQISVTKSKTPPSPPHPNASLPNKQAPSNDRKWAQNPSDNQVASDVDQKSSTHGSTAVGNRIPRSKDENLPKKVCIEFGESGTSDTRIVLSGSYGLSVKLNVHRNVLVGNSSFFAEKLVEKERGGGSCLQIDDCEDVEIYVETIGLMYCKDMKKKLMKQSVRQVLRILKVAQAIGFISCIPSCLDYLEAVPWVGEEEEEKVVTSVLRLQNEGVGNGINPVLKRVSSNVAKPPKDTLSHILELVLKSNEDRGRREMKSVVLKLLRENKSNLDSDTTSPDLCYETIYASCRSSLNSLVSHVRKATTEPEFCGGPMDSKEPLAKQIALEADNLAWLLDILAERQVADEFAVMWSGQQELAGLHQKVAAMNRYHISCVTARLFVGIGRGELLPSKEVRLVLLQTWLEPLMSDYSWLNHGCRWFDRKIVEEGLGRTILTLPLEDQQSIMLSWLSSFLKSGDNCPNLQNAFQVWWRRTFVRPYNELRTDQRHSEN